MNCKCCGKEIEEDRKKFATTTKEGHEATMRETTLTQVQKDQIGTPPAEFNKQVFLKGKIKDLENGNKIDQDVADEMEKEVSEVMRLKQQKTLAEDRLDSVDQKFNTIVADLQSTNTPATKVNIENMASQRTLAARGRQAQLETDVKTESRKANPDWSAVAQMKTDIEKAKDEIQEYKNLYKLKNEEQEKIDNSNKKIKDAEKRQKGEEEE